MKKPEEPKLKYQIKTFTVMRCAETDLGTATSPARVAVVAASLFKGLDASREHFFVLVLNSRYEVSGFKLISSGTLNASIVHPRDVFGAALRLDAAALLLCHNHPSGSVDPSDDDVTLTKNLVAAGQMLNIPVLDHVIVAANGKWYSMKHEGDMA